MESKKKTPHLIDKINSGKVSECKTALTEFRESGTNKMLDPLSQAYDKYEDAEIKRLIENIFSDLKNQDSVDEFMHILTTTKSDSIKKMLLSACWQSRLDFSSFYEIFILMAIELDFELAFEAFTIIENNEQKVSGNRKEQLITFTKDNMSKCKESNLPLASDMVKIISNYEE